jgi:hypothetical protein
MNHGLQRDDSFPLIEMLAENAAVILSRPNVVVYGRRAVLG